MSQEKIENQTPPEITPLAKPPLYRSAFMKSLRAKSKQHSGHHHHQTMGYSEVPLKPPSQFLKKNSRKVTIPNVEKKKIGCNAVNLVQRPPGTDEAEKLWMPLRSARPINYIRANCFDATRMVPPLPKHRVQHTRNGTIVLDLEKSGLEPKYVLKENYGKKPKYLIKMNNDHDTRKRLEKERIIANTPPSPFRLVSDEERNEMINGLKKKMKDDYKMYHSFPLVVELTSMIRRKSALKSVLQNTEKKIDILNRHKTIYVARNA